MHMTNPVFEGPGAQRVAQNYYSSTQISGRTKTKAQGSIDCQLRLWIYKLNWKITHACIDIDSPSAVIG